MREIGLYDTVRVRSTGHIGKVVSTTAFGEYCRVGYEDGIRLNNYPIPFHREELEVVQKYVPTPSPTDTIISAFNDMEKEIDTLKVELASVRKQLAQAKAETQHAIAMFEHYKLFHPVH